MSKVNRMKHLRVGRPDRAARVEKNRNDMAGKALRSLRRRNGLSVTEFRRFRRHAGLVGQPISYSAAVRALGGGR